MNYYNELVKIITSKDKFLINLGLERISAVMDFFNNPQNSPKVIHIAGTNGKGSTAHIIAQILQESGFKTGLYTSPHIKKYNERIKINGENIDDKRLFKLLSEILDTCRENSLKLTEFELLTAAAFLFFEREKVDFLVLETGLGGRLDAANIVKKPLLTIITSISKDHTERLGDTIEKIAAEKAGIIKENCPVIISPDNSGYKVVSAIAKEKNSSIITPKSKISTMPDIRTNKVKIDGKEFEFALRGEFQTKNLALAIAASEYLNIGKDAVCNGLKNVRHAARFEYIEELNLIIDGAHNQDGAKSLKESLEKYFANDKKCFIYASINTKDFKNFLKTVITDSDRLFLYDFKRQNAVKTKEIQKDFKNTGIIDGASVLRLINNNRKEKILTIITGSIYAIGDLHALIFKDDKYSPIG